MSVIVESREQGKLAWSKQVASDKQPMIEVRGLRRFYGKLEAVKDVTFSIPQRCIFGLLGPNGAGKTTTLEMIEGLRRPDSGTVRIKGLDPFRDTKRVRELLGAQLQSTSIQERVRVGEILRVFASFYRQPASIDELISQMKLEHRRNAFFEHLSGGERQRLALALALVGNPEIVILDEPTTGLDAEIRQSLHELILQLRDQGRTVILTTHYIEEAERLCDFVGILEQGKLHTIGKPADLIQELGEGDRLEIEFRDSVSTEELKRWVGSEIRVVLDEKKYICRGANGSKMLASIAVHSDRNHNEIVEAKIIHPTLEDVYLRLTNRRISA